MIEIKDGINWRNFYLDSLPKSWFKKDVNESNGEWFERVAYADSGWLEKAQFRRDNQYWIKDSVRISLAVLSFLRENNIKKEDLEEQLNFDLSLKGDHEYTIKEIRKIEQVIKKRIWR